MMAATCAQNVRKYLVTNLETTVRSADLSWSIENKQYLTWLERLELEKAMIGRGIDYETAEQILIDFQKRMDRFGKIQF